MKVKNIIKGLIASFLLITLAGSCDSLNDALIEGVGNTREFSPVALKATVRNKTSVELNWTVNEAVDHYVIEFSADDPNFGTIFKTVEVTGAQLPVTVALEGETLYSIRVKAVSSGDLEDSKWTITTANTLSEDLFLAVQDGDIAAKEATLRWVAGNNVTKIVLTPGDITHTITDEEKATGIATVTGLSSETSYQADLFNGTKKRGATTFTTGIDVGDGILVKNTEDLLVVIANADSGAKLFLEPGDYKSFGADGVTASTEILLTKSITISGIAGKAKPVLHYKITAGTGTSNISLLNLDLDGTGITNGSVLTFATTGNFGDVLISGCKVHDFVRSLFSNTAGVPQLKSFTVDNTIVKNVNTNIGADFIDVRFGFIKDIVLQNSTFDTCSDSRDFIRVDGDATNTLNNTGLTTNVLINSCTLYKVSTTVASKRILYLRFASNTSTVKNTLITDTATALYSNQNGTAKTPTTPPTFSGNNYYNANLLYTTAGAAATTTLDKSTTYTTFDPGYANASAGDFTISNQTLKDNKVGDPRWIK